MAVLDPSTPIGKIRLRVGDWKDLVILPDAVIQSALDDCNANVPRAASLCAQYILATLTANTHKKLQQIEVWSGEQFNNYVSFLKTTILNPNFMPVTPIPYGFNGDTHPLIQFTEDWNNSYSTDVPSDL